MSTPARLTGSDGKQLAAGALHWRGARLGPDLVAAARRFAFRHGRVIERDGAAVLTWDVAAQIEFPRGTAEPGAAERAHGLLAAIPGHNDAGMRPGPLALGALPFDAAAPGALVIPGLAVVVAEGGDAAVVAVGRNEHIPPPVESLQLAITAADDAENRDGEAPDRFRVDSVRPHEDFLTRVGAAPTRSVPANSTRSSSPARSPSSRTGGSASTTCSNAFAPSTRRARPSHSTASSVRARSSSSAVAIA